MKKPNHGSIHPMIVFWLGVLTGALVVGFLFFYSALQSEYFQGYSFFKASPTVKTVQPYSIGGDGEHYLPGTNFIGGDGDHH